MTAWRMLPRLALGAAITGAAIWLALHRDSLDPALIKSSIRDLGPWAPIGHVVLFAVATTPHRGSGLMRPPLSTMTSTASLPLLARACQTPVLSRDRSATSV